MIFEVDGMEVIIIDEGDRMVVHMNAGHGFEPESLAVWAKLVQPGKVALDVGAYTGIYSIVAAKRGAQAVALEPMPAARWRLQCNTAANKVAVLIHAVAASDDNGVAKLRFSRHTPLTTGASLESGIEGHTDTIDVPTVTIDALALTNLCAVKIDVERHEPCVLRGAMKTIERDRPSMLIETLNNDMRTQVLHSLPSYAIAAILDRRNTLFVPK
jgi:FkbM family methyltransferase